MKMWRRPARTRRTGTARQKAERDARHDADGDGREERAGHRHDASQQDRERQELALLRPRLVWSVVGDDAVRTAPSDVANTSVKFIS